MPRQGKATQVPKFVNKTQEIYQYIADHKGDDERQIAKGLAHLSAPVIHASLKMLHDGGYVTKTDTTATNKIGRPICKFEIITTKKYEPTYTRRPDGSRATTGKVRLPVALKTAAESTYELRKLRRKVPTNPVSEHESGLKLTVPTENGPMILTLSGAQGVYTQLKKLFGGR